MMGLFKWSSALKVKDTSIFSRAVRKKRAEDKGKKAPRARKAK